MSIPEQEKHYLTREYNTSRFKKYRSTEKGRLAQKKANKNYEAKHPERRKAWDKAQIIKISPCVICGDENVHRHHPDISKPLEVVFLCPLHHRQEHLKNKPKREKTVKVKKELKKEKTAIQKVEDFNFKFESLVESGIDQNEAYFIATGLLDYKKKK